MRRAEHPWNVVLAEIEHLAKTLDHMGVDTYEGVWEKSQPLSVTVFKNMGPEPYAKRMAKEAFVGFCADWAEAEQMIINEGVATKATHRQPARL